MLHKVEIADYMLKQPITGHPELTIYEAALLIVENKVSGLVIVDDKKQLLGMLSELDCLKAIMASAYNDGEVEIAKVKDVMTKNVIFQNPRDSIIDVADSMFRYKHKRRPVLSQNKLVGQLTCREILNVITKNYWRM